MDIVVDFPGGARVDAHFGEFTIATDQPAQGGGQDSAPTPFDTFLASIGTCVGIYVLGFCKERGLPTDDIRVVQRVYRNNNDHGMVDKIDLKLQVPPSFPDKYYNALIRSASQCLVKKHLEKPPQFDINTEIIQP